MLDYDSLLRQNFSFFCEVSIREIYSFGTAVKNQIRKICDQSCISLKRVIYKKLVLNSSQVTIGIQYTTVLITIENKRQIKKVGAEARPKFRKKKSVYTRKQSARIVKVDFYIGRNDLPNLLQCHELKRNSDVIGLVSIRS